MYFVSKPLSFLHCWNWFHSYTAEQSKLWSVLVRMCNELKSFQKEHSSWISFEQRFSLNTWMHKSILRTVYKDFYYIPIAKLCWVSLFVFPAIGNDVVSGRVGYLGVHLILSQPYSHHNTACPPRIWKHNDISDLSDRVL